MMRVIAFILLLFVLVISTGCPENFDEPDSTVVLKNTSNMDIVHLMESRLVADTALPLPTPFPGEGNIANSIIPADSSRAYTDSYIQGFEENPNKVLMIWFFSRDSVEQLSWDSIVTNYQILRRYDLTLNDLEAMNWTAEYP
ncbi:MAG: hypothetical protein LC664_12570 [Flavobacteriales bacterium]|nr:hypothetical protein [Flavobacteriales bacterium]